MKGDLRGRLGHSALRLELFSDDIESASAWRRRREWGDSAVERRFSEDLAPVREVNIRLEVGENLTYIYKETKE